jgi:hypothetical protein
MRSVSGNLRLFLFPVVLALAACSPQHPAPARGEAPPAAGPGPASLVSALPPADGRTLRFRLSAPAGQPLHLENCNGAISWGLEREVAGAWKPAWTVATDACHSAPVVIPPGESRVFDEVVTLGTGEDLQAGTYRIAVHGLYRRHDREDHAANPEVPRHLRVSRPFALGPLAAP